MVLLQKVFRKHPSMLCTASVSVAFASRRCKPLVRGTFSTGERYDQAGHRL